MRAIKYSIGAFLCLLLGLQQGKAQVEIDQLDGVTITSDEYYYSQENIQLNDVIINSGLDLEFSAIGEISVTGESHFKGGSEVELNNLIALDLIVEGGEDQRICSACPLELGTHVQVTGGIGPYTYRWTPSNSFASASDPVLTLPAGSAGDYTLKVTDALGNWAKDVVHVEVDSECQEHLAQEGTAGFSTCEFPLTTDHKTSHQELIYTKSELGGAGSISSIGFYKVSETAFKSKFSNVKVYLKHTVEDKFKYDLLEVDYTGYTLVYSGDVSNENALNYWVTIPLDETFYYDGQSNLQVLFVQEDQDDYIPNGCVSFDATAKLCCSRLRAFVNNEQEKGRLSRIYDPVYQTQYTRPKMKVEYCDPVYFTDKDIVFQEVENGYFYDSGGDALNYGSGECYTVTFFPKHAQDKLRFDFMFFDTEYSAACDGDFIEVYNGPSTSDPSLGGFCGAMGPGTVTSSHETGAMTFVFYSNNSIEQAGWKAKISSEHHLLSIDAGEDRTLCKGCGTPLGGTPVVTGGTPPYRFEWSPADFVDNAYVANPYAQPEETTTYTLTVYDAHGLSGSDQVTVHVGTEVDREVVAGDFYLPQRNWSRLYPFDVHSPTQYSRTESIYFADELDGQGVITYLEYDRVDRTPADTPGELQNLEIYIKHTTSSHFVEDNTPVDLSTYVQVFGQHDVPLNYPEESCCRVTLEEPFNYNGEDNVQVLFVHGPQIDVPTDYPEWSVTYSSSLLPGGSSSEWDLTRLNNESNWSGQMYLPKEIPSRAPETYTGYPGYVWTTTSYQARPDVRFGITAHENVAFSDQTASFELVPGDKVSSSKGTGFLNEDGTYNTSYFYDANEDYGMVLMPQEEGQVISLRIDEFNFPSNSSCEEDYVEVYNGSDAYGTLIGRYCNTSIADAVTLTSTDESGALFVKVNSNDDDDRGFFMGTVVSPVEQQFNVDAGGETYACDGCEVSLGGIPTARGGIGRSYTYSWQPTTGLDNPSAANPKLVVTDDMDGMEYTVEVTNAVGTASAVATIHVVDQEHQIEIGTSNSYHTTGYPIDMLKTYSFGDYRYGYDEINWGGTITGITLFDDNVHDQGKVIDGVQIYMKNTLPTTNLWVSESGYELVYEGAVRNANGHGEVAIVLDKPFYHRKGKNLQIRIVRNGEAASNTGVPSWRVAGGDAEDSEFYAGAFVSSVPPYASNHGPFLGTRPALRLNFDNAGNQQGALGTTVQLNTATINGTYQTSRDGVLNLYYDEIYNNKGFLRYEIVDENLKPFDNLPLHRVGPGDNYVELDLKKLSQTTGLRLVSGNIYSLKVTGPKGTIYRLKFKYFYSNTVLDTMNATSTIE